MLANLLKAMPKSTHPDLLVGFETSDDAGVFRLNSEQAIVQTVDFFPPIVDDPFWFGQIAAANALSDIYAMGGRPLTALNLVGFPASLPEWVLAEMIRGGTEKVIEAGAVIIGGHSIKDKELKYGLSVTGIVHPDRILTNAGAKVGDRLFLTKPIGTGIIATGIKRNMVGQQEIDQVIAQMATLNRLAAEACDGLAVTAMTDVTGFGLLGHASEMANGSGVTLELSAHAIPLLAEARRLASLGVLTGGAADTRSFLADQIHLTSSAAQSIADLLFDPQTSGGLLIAVADRDAAKLSAALAAKRLPSETIGSVVLRSTVSVVVS